MRYAKQYTVRRGITYKALFLLNGWESIASNQMIARKLRGYGFQKVVVTGTGRNRTATGVWGGADTTVEMPKQVAAVSAVA